MIRPQDSPIDKLDDWKGRKALLTISDAANTKFLLEEVTILEVTPVALLCRDDRGRAQVYVFGGGVLKAWEEPDERNAAELARQKQVMEIEANGGATPIALNRDGEPTVVRKVLTPAIPTRTTRNGIIEVEKL